jgi:enoyl-[acyl-carrier protein] reductase/trans-2-enoyl-CoA reductase (NAD+)
MIIKPKTRGFICTTAHPVGCAHQVEEQIEYVKGQGLKQGPKKVLVIGASTGYGLASRIVSSFEYGADTIGVFFERPGSEERTASAGWYNTAAFEHAAQKAGIYAKSINGDAFSDEIKQQTIEAIKQSFGKVDLVVYSLASPRRNHPKTGESFTSVLKPIGKSYTNKTVNFHTAEVTDITIDPANEEEIRQTVAVMGGEDWMMWIEALKAADVLAEGVQTLAYSYIGPDLTLPVYREGTIGRAKDDLEASAGKLTKELEGLGGRAFVSVNKALVTQSSAAIPVVPLYISILFKVMKENGSHEGCIEQIHRLFADRLYQDGEVPVDEAGRIRLDDWEMKPEIQSEVAKLWAAINSDNIHDISDIESYRTEFFKLFGFEIDGINYDEDVNPDVPIA